MKKLKDISIFSDKPVLVHIDEKRISKVEELSEAESTDAKMPYISPGFLDIQVNGFNGIDYSLEDLKAEQIEILIHSLAQSGASRHTATFVTIPNERLLRNLALLAEAMEKNVLIQNGIAGFHLEGPFRSEERRVGKECRSRWSPYH